MFSYVEHEKKEKKYPPPSSYYVMDFVIWNELVKVEVHLWNS